MNTPSFTTIWTTAARPRTLAAAVIPVFVGASLAHDHEQFQPLNSFLAFLVALFIQVGTNFTNDLYDFLRGADTKKRVGQKRVLNEGWVTPRTMQVAIYLTFGTAFLLGLPLIVQHGYILLFVGIISILSGFAYTAGPYPLAYNGLGDIFVLIFFGFVATCGTYFVNTGLLTLDIFLLALPVGALITSILVVNNFRDADQDKLVNKNTLAVLFGKRFAQYEYAVLIVGAYVSLLLLLLIYPYNVFIMLPFLALPLAVSLIRDMFTKTGSELNKTLENTAKHLAFFGVLLCIGLLL